MKTLPVALGLAALFGVVWSWSPGRTGSAARAPAPGSRAESEQERGELTSAPAVDAQERRTRAEEHVPPPVPAEPEADPCAELRAEFAATEASLRHQITALQRNDGLSPVAHLATLPDAELLDERGRKFLEALLASDMPFYLRPGEALWIAELEAADAYSTTEVIRFLGPQRLLAEAPPEWVKRQELFIDDAEWLELFGTPRSPDAPIMME